MRQPTPYPPQPAWVRIINLVVVITIVTPILLSFLMATHRQVLQYLALGITGLWLAIFGCSTMLKPFTISAYFERHTMLGPITPQNTSGLWLLGFRLIGAFLLAVGALILLAAYALLFLPPR
jgi:hypothetical protein